MNEHSLGGTGKIGPGLEQRFIVGLASSRKDDQFIKAALNLPCVLDGAHEVI